MKIQKCAVRGGDPGPGIWKFQCQENLKVHLSFSTLALQMMQR